MRYRDDQCEECGGIRVARSTLCAACLVRAGYEDGLRRAELENEIEGLVREIKNLRGMLEDAVWYGFKQNRKIFHLEKQIKESIDIIKRGLEDGKERETANTEK